MANCTKRIEREFKKFNNNKKPDEIISAEIKNGDINSWIVKIKGPKDTPYEGGIFNLRVKFTSEYPFKCPHVGFITKIWHPNVDECDGSICLDTLSSNWSPVLSMVQLIISIISLLDDPNAGDPMNGTAGRQYNSNRKEYNKTVREYVEKYAVEKND